MPKSHNWFATDHLRFIKLVGHFYKMFWYFYQGKTKRQKNKTEEEIEKKEPWQSGPTLLPPAHQAAQPSLPRCRLLHARQSRQLGGEPWARRRPRDARGF